MSPGRPKMRPGRAQEARNEPQEAPGGKESAPATPENSLNHHGATGNHRKGPPDHGKRERFTARPPDHGKRERFTVGPPDHGKLKRFTRVQRQVPENSFHHRGATRKRSSFGRAPLKQLLFMIPLSVFSLGRFWAWGGTLGGGESSSGAT